MIHGDKEAGMSGQWTGQPEFAFLVAAEEDRFTEYLNQLLQHPSLLRRFLSEFCQIAIDERYAAPLVRTQVRIPGGRPDLVIREDPFVYVLCEAKVGGWFHDGQLSTYVDDLERWTQIHPDGERRLLVLCPRRSLEFALDDADAVLEKRTSSSNLVAGVSWEQVSAFMAEYAEEVEDQRFAFHLREFQRVVETRLGKELRPFTDEEARVLSDPLAAQSLVRVWALLEDLKEALAEHLEDASFSVACGRGYDGYWLNLEGGSWWFGVWYEVWASVRCPLVIQLNGWSGRAILEVDNSLTKAVVVDTPWGKECVVPLRIHATVDPRELVKGFVKIIDQYVKAYPESGAAP